MIRSICCWMMLFTVGAGTVPGEDSSTLAKARVESAQGAQSQPGVPPASANTLPRPNPDASGRYHVGDGVTAPRVVFQFEPEFTEEARKKKIRGDCLIGATVDTDGIPQHVVVIRSIAETATTSQRAAALSLDAKAIEAVKQYRWKPAIFKGKPVPVEVQITVNFQIF